MDPQMDPSAPMDQNWGALWLSFGALAPTWGAIVPKLAPSGAAFEGRILMHGRSENSIQKEGPCIRILMHFGPLWATTGHLVLHFGGCFSVRCPALTSGSSRITLSCLDACSQYTLHGLALSIVAVSSLARSLLPLGPRYALPLVGHIAVLTLGCSQCVGLSLALASCSHHYSQQKGELQILLVQSSQ